MIANISPSLLSYEDTHNTLQYADRAKNIRTRVQKNETNLGLHLSQYRGLIHELRSEISELKDKSRGN